MKLSFKKVPRSSGLAGMGEADSCEILADKCVVGSISGGHWRSTDSKYRVMFKVAREKTQEDPCAFKWIVMKSVFDTMDAAKIAIRQSWSKICERHKLFKD